MNGLKDLVWFVLAGVVMPTILLALLGRRGARDDERTAAETQGMARRDGEKT
jgi:hypothetical protein